MPLGRRGGSQHTVLPASPSLVASFLPVPAGDVPTVQQNPPRHLLMVHQEEGGRSRVVLEGSRNHLFGCPKGDARSVVQLQL